MGILSNIKEPAAKSAFTKLSDGSNKLRILGEVTVGWEGWKAKKPYRHYHEDNVGSKFRTKDLDVDAYGNQRATYFWVCPVWSYDAKEIQIFQIKTKQVRDALISYEKDADYGDLLKLDLNIEKSGKGSDTVYTVKAKEPKELSEEISKEWESKKQEIQNNISAMFNFDEFPVSGSVENNLPPSGF